MVVTEDFLRKQCFCMAYSGKGNMFDARDENHELYKQNSCL
jgi:hypothetical protein